MKNLKIVCFTVLSLGISILIASVGWTQPRTEIKAPVITNAYAPDKG